MRIRNILAEIIMLFAFRNRRSCAQNIHSLSESRDNVDTPYVRDGNAFRVYETPSRPSCRAIVFEMVLSLIQQCFHYTTCSRFQCPEGTSELSNVYRWPLGILDSPSTYFTNVRVYKIAE